MLTEGQIEFRKSHITSAMWGAIISGDHGGWLRVLRDMIYGSTLESNLRMELGEIAEEEIGLWGMSAAGGFEDYRLQVEVEDRACPLIGSHIDFIGCRTVGDVDEEIIFECKLVFPENAWKWKDGPSAYAAAQLQCQMMCLAAPYGYVAAWVIDGNPEKRLYRVEADHSLWEYMRTRAPLLFEKYITPGVMPDGVWEENPEMMVEVLAPVGRSGEIQLAKNFGKVLDVYEESCATIRTGDRQKAWAKAQILKSLGPCAKGLLPGGRSVEIKVSKNGAQRIVVCGKGSASCDDET